MKNAVKQQKRYATESQEITFDKELKMKTAINYNNTQLTFQQVLTATQSDQCILVPIFIQVHWYTNEQKWVGIY